MTERPGRRPSRGSSADRGRRRRSRRPGSGPRIRPRRVRRACPGDAGGLRRARAAPAYDPSRRRGGRGMSSRSVAPSEQVLLEEVERSGDLAHAVEDSVRHASISLVPAILAGTGRRAQSSRRAGPTARPASPCRTSPDRRTRPAADPAALRQWPGDDCPRPRARGRRPPAVPGRGRARDPRPARPGAGRRGADGAVRAGADRRSSRPTLRCSTCACPASTGRRC